VSLWTKLGCFASPVQTRQTETDKLTCASRPGYQVGLPPTAHEDSHPPPHSTAQPAQPSEPLQLTPRSTFSPEGRLFQVEYSLEAIKLGSTAIGVATSKGVILGVEKRVTSTLLETSSVEKIVEIDRHIGCAMSGLQADARSMVEHARVECQSHAFNYNEKLRVESCTQAICDLALRFGESADGEESIMSRPFGVALLIAGYDEDGPSLYHAEPSGTFYRYDAKAIGSGSEGAQAELQNEYHKVPCPLPPEFYPQHNLPHILTTARSASPSLSPTPRPSCSRHSSRSWRRSSTPRTCNLPA
jgi:20S proteasome subunit alpha 5